MNQLWLWLQALDRTLDHLIIVMLWYHINQLFKSLKQSHEDTRMILYYIYKNHNHLYLYQIIRINEFWWVYIILQIYFFIKEIYKYMCISTLPVDAALELHFSYTGCLKPI